MKYFLFPLFLLTSFASCKKDNSNQPTGPSNSGKNILSCKVNGVVHQYSGLVDWINRGGVNSRRFIDRVDVNARGINYNDDINLDLYLPPDSIQSNTTYQLSTETNSTGKYWIFQLGNPTVTYVTTPGSGWIRFSRVDTAVAAGTFAFTAYIDGQQGQDSVVITEGVFDIAVQ